MNDVMPSIGLTGRREHVRDRTVHVVDTDYAEAVVEAGGLPVLVPPITPEQMPAYLDRLDGLVVTGGGDVDPAQYGAAPSPLVGGVDPVRDAAELALLHAAIERRMPVLGICRGCQVMNVALGGTLIVHLPDVTDLPHLVPEARHEAVHEVWPVAGSQLADAIGEEVLPVNSIHHQAVWDLAPGVRPVAWAADGVVEAIETEGAPAFGVQWHPENLQRYPRQRALFEWLIDAASRCGLEQRSGAGSLV